VTATAPARGYDVVVCGAGVAGLTLARILGDQGRRVLVIEREREFRDAYKGEVVQPRALEVLSSIGVLNKLEKCGALRADHFTARMPDGRDVGDLDYAGLPGPFNYVLIHDVQEIQQTLAAGLPPNVEVRYGASGVEPLVGPNGRVSGLRMTWNGVSVDVSAPLTVACDGRGSKIRKAAALGAAIQRYDHEFVAFDLADVTGLGSRLSAFVTPQGVRLLLPMPGNRARLYVQTKAGVFRRQDRRNITAWFDWLLSTVPALAPLDKSLHASEESVRILSIWRHGATRWVRPGFALVGDAAHCVHPIAAQGMSCAIDDARSLGERLGQVRSFVPAEIDAALAGYESAQLPRQAYASRLSHTIAKLFTDTTLTGRAVRNYELHLINTNQRLRRALVYNMSGLGGGRHSFTDLIHQFSLPDAAMAQAMTSSYQMPQGSHMSQGSQMSHSSHIMQGPQMLKSPRYGQA
jgi:2-polyprenyl-6-methoxyphenol hydroxylase-like FAD-dependent oxidoreductase